MTSRIDHRRSCSTRPGSSAGNERGSRRDNAERRPSTTATWQRERRPRRLRRPPAGEGHPGHARGRLLRARGGHVPIRAIDPHARDQRSVRSIYPDLERGPRLRVHCAGAQLQTLTPICRLGSVLLRLPDLRALQSTLQWSSSHKAGVSFELPLSVEEFSAWVDGRAELTPHMRRLTIADITDLAA